MSARQPPNIQPKRILVITLRYLGDTLLVTPLISSLKRAYPDAEIDVLLPSGNVGMLEGNPDVSGIIPVAVKPDFLSFAKLLIKLFRRYDLAISTQGGDRPILCAVLAARFSMGFVSRTTSRMAWKRLLLDRVLEVDDKHTHAVLENLRFCGPLGIERFYRLTPPRAREKSQRLNLDTKYAVLHIMPQWRYKHWHDEGWVRLAYFLQQKGCQIVLTGSPQAEELNALRRLQQRLPPSTRNLAGKLSLSELTALIETAAIFVGPDTGITHLAAATGVSTVAIFGPTDPAKWAPWPHDYVGPRPPFVSSGSQHINNVYLVQGASERGCVPCQLEGCDRSRQSYAACLDNLSAEVLIDLVDKVI